MRSIESANFLYRVFFEQQILYNEKREKKKRITHSPKTVITTYYESAPEN